MYFTQSEFQLSTFCCCFVTIKLTSTAGSGATIVVKILLYIHKKKSEKETWKKEKSIWITAVHMREVFSFTSRMTLICVVTVVCMSIPAELCRLLVIVQRWRDIHYRFTCLDQLLILELYMFYIPQNQQGWSTSNKEEVVEIWRCLDLHI